jgi:hypothetical protein
LPERGPRRILPGMRRDTPDDVLKHELQGEIASSLGRAGRRLSEALARLRDPAAERGAALAEARDALWCYVVQREAIGLPATEEAVRAYDPPPEVAAGILVGRPVRRRLSR